MPFKVVLRPRAVAPSSRRRLPPRRPRRRFALLAGLVVLPLLASSLALGYYYVTFSRLIDARLRGEREHTEPRVYARPFELRRGQAMTRRELVDRLNDLGYAERPRVEGPGEFALDETAVSIMIRGGDLNGQLVRVAVREPSRRDPAGRVVGLERSGGSRVEVVTLEAPLITALHGDGREKRRYKRLDEIPTPVVQAVLAIEDRRFYDHPGVDIIRTIGALLTNLRGDRPYLVGGSTLTQQLVKNFFLTPEKTIRRKLLEQFMAIILERRLSKDEILELYLNEVYLGQRGSFAVHGMPEGARLFFGKDVVNLSLAEAATLAGVIQSPQTYSPVRAPERSRARRDLVLRTMVEAGYLSPEAADRAAEIPLATVPQAVEAEAPYFVDMMGQMIEERFAGVAGNGTLDVYTTLDLHLQRMAQDAVRSGLQQVDAVLSRRRNPAAAQAALVAIDPRTGDILALVGGRAYSQSQFNRALSARRQPGSVIKPFVYLAAFETALREGRTDLTPATLVMDEPTTFYYEDKEWSPGNYGDEYDGAVSLRHALAHSRNVATARVAEMIGFGRVADLWSHLGTSMKPQAYPSIALGVFEATPLEIAEAYTLFPNGGGLRPLRSVLEVRLNGRVIDAPAPPPLQALTDARTTFLVTNMMRSVIDEGTGAGARAMGFALDAAGKSGTTNDLRDAWFVGFTPELLTTVWVGFDDNRPIGLSGTQAAVPIWAAFMTRALSGHASVEFPVPEGVNVVAIDPDTGQLAAPGCPRVITESFLPGTEPPGPCALHSY